MQKALMKGEFHERFFGAFMRGNKPPVILGEDKNFSI